MGKRDKLKAEIHQAGGVFDCLYDEKFTLLEGRDNLYTVLGYTGEEIRTIFHGCLIEFIQEDERQALRDEIERQLTAGNVFMHEYRLKSKNRKTQWLWISAELRHDETGRPFFHCIFHDITDSKNDQEKLALSEQRYDIVLSQMQDIIFELDCLTFDIYYSPHFEEKFGYQIPVKGFPDSMFNTDIIHEKDKGELRRKFQSLLCGETQMYHEYRIKHTDGYYLWVDVHATTMVDQAGKILKIMGIISDINKRKTEILETKKMASLDPLTGLLNRRGSVQRVNEYIESCDILAALLVIDIDNFKTFNDTMGHLYGDSVLSDISAGLLAVFRQNDIVARFGGDEFVIFLPMLRKKENIVGKLESIHELFRKPAVPGAAPEISCSIGVSFYPEHGTDFTTLFANADAAMYHAKNHGKGQYCIFSDDDLPIHRSLPKPLAALVDEERIDFLMDCIPSGLTGVRLQAGFPLCFINPCMLRYLGFQSQEEYEVFTGGSMAAGIFAEDRETAAAGILKALKESGEYQAEYRMYKKDGGLIWIRGDGRKVRDHEGKNMVISVCVDISRYKEMEETVIDL